MPITLTHVAGPLAGQTQTFEDDHERIVIGRDASLCDVVFPPDATLVGREHCALLRKISGDYALDVFGQHYVAIDGEPAQPEAAVVSGQTLTFGCHDGPRLAVSIQRAGGTADLFATSDQQKVPSLWRSEHRTRIVAALAVLVALVAGGGFLFEQHQLSDETARSLAIVGQMSALSAAQRQQASEQISPEARQHLSEAVYAVILRDSSGGEYLLGTAWGVAPDKLATNAHVAVEMQKMKPGGTMVVRPSGVGQVGFTVKSVSIHPGYAAFGQFVKDDALLIKTYAGWQQVDTIGGYDVALLNIDGTLPPSAILPVADDAELASLEPGSPLAFAGYPYENVSGSSVQPIGRTSIVQLGNLTAATDYFLLPAAFGERYLIGHSLPATGGASGSPIIDAQNHVVALLSDGNINMLNNMRIPSAAQINYGQRVDVLRDLLDGRAEARLTADEPYWRKVTSAFGRGADVVIASVLADMKPDATAKPLLSGSGDFQIGADNRYTPEDTTGKATTIRYKLMNLDVAPKSRHFVIAYGKGLTPIAAISLIENGKVVMRQEGKGSWAALNFTAPDTGGQVSILVEMADTDVDLIVRDYLWSTSSS